MYIHQLINPALASSCCVHTPTAQPKNQHVYHTSSTGALTISYCCIRPSCRHISAVKQQCTWGKHQPLMPWATPPIGSITLGDLTLANTLACCTGHCCKRTQSNGSRPSCKSINIAAVTAGQCLHVLGAQSTQLLYCAILPGG